MRAIDTNVLVRLLIEDDPAQTAVAAQIFAQGRVFIGTTVLLETGWVLRSAYRFSPARIARKLREVAGLPGVTLEEPAVAAQALDWHEQGMDFADALHLALAADCETFITFDRKLGKSAKRLGAMPVEQH